MVILSVFQIESLANDAHKSWPSLTQRLAETIVKCIFEFIYDGGKEKRKKFERKRRFFYSFSLYLDQIFSLFFLIIYLKNHRMVED